MADVKLIGDGRGDFVGWFVVFVLESSGTVDERESIQVNRIPCSSQVGVQEPRIETKARSARKLQGKKKVVDDVHPWRASMPTHGLAGTYREQLTNCPKSGLFCATCSRG